jgi:protein gp37/ParB-like chromosome segregation protein Spo0J
MIPVGKLCPHPKNPRLQPRQDVVDQIAAQIENGFDHSHALIVRPVAGQYEIISGHHRYLAALEVDLAEVPCWVRDYDDAAAYMQLVLCNTQSELHPLEEGKHAAESGLDLKAYAEQAGKERTLLNRKVMAWRVLSVCHVTHSKVAEDWRNLAEIHAAPQWLWRALARAMLAEGWTVQKTRERVAQCKEWQEPPEWAGCDSIAINLVGGVARYSDIARMASTVEKMAVHDVSRRARVMEALHLASPTTLSKVQEIVSVAEQEEAEESRQKQRRAEEAATRTVRLRSNCSLEQWEQLGLAEREALLTPNASAASSFNKQQNADIEWAQWSWNPVTGCKHDCSYCYARDIATSTRMADIYPNGFEPTFRSNALAAPANTKVPPGADKDARFRNVFTCSMADLFGRWVPKAWIEAVLDTVRRNPQWNFLFLTKFPTRMAEFDIPPNAWMGTTVDLQARVANAERAFENVRCGVRWLSVEPMIEPLQFNHLERFDWVVIGGASPSSRTPEWRPPYRWIEALVAQCDAAKVKVYFKTNLGVDNRIIELPFDAAVTHDRPQVAPEPFHYLNSARKSKGDAA